MDKLFRPFIAALLVFASTHALADANEVLLYRYINSQGAKVVAYSIPPKFVGKGYEVINRQGLVLEVVAPELSKAEKDRQRQLKQEQEKLDEWDQRLLRRYSYPSEIEEAKLRKLSKVEASKNLIQNHINNINREIEKYQATAATQERRDGKVSPKVLTIINSLFSERLINEQKLKNAEADVESEAKRFDQDIERFKKIKIREANAHQHSANDEP